MTVYVVLGRDDGVSVKLVRYGITWSDVELLFIWSSYAQIGRPHIANWLVNKGIARSMDDAFERYLGVGRPGYADKYRIDCEAAIQLIRCAGGAPVLAHPALISPRGDWRLEALLARLKTIGLIGLEAYYPEHTPMQTQTYLAWAEQYNLVATGGTDFHGRVKPDVDLGIAGGDFHVPYSCFTALRSRIKGMQPGNGEAPPCGVRVNH